jgi:hypothetical protein
MYEEMRGRSVFISAAAMFSTVCALSSAQDVGSTPVTVLTWQNDQARTGQNLNEGGLVYGSLSKLNFGQRCSLQLDGQVYAQPLVVTHSKINGTTYNYVVYVVTQNDTLYAINGTPPSGTGGTCGPTQSLSFLTTGAAPVDCSNVGHMDCMTIGPKVGILGTPVIAVANHTATMYLVTETQTGTSPPFTFYHYLHAVDLPTLTEVSVVQIYPPGQQGSSSTFSQTHIQRPGLLYTNGYVYVAFSMMDGAGTPYPNGAIFRYNASTLAASGYFQTSAGQNNADGGGVWQGSAGLAYGPDSPAGTNYIYFNTANGVFDADTGGTNYGDSFVKLDPTAMTVATNGTFTPADQYFRSTATCNSGNSPGDYDFGSGGVMLIPPHELNTPYLAVGGDKEGGLWFMNLANPGGHKTTCDGNCSCNVTDHGNIQAWPISSSISYLGPVVHTNPAFWETTAGTNYLYVGPERMRAITGSGELLQYTLCPTGKPINSTCGTVPVAATDQNSVPVVFPYGVTPSISQSASDSTDAIVWAIKGDGSIQGSTVVGQLYAFKAVEMTQLYSSTLCTGDALQYPATKFSVPTVANGFVYVGGQGPFNTVQNNWNSGMFYIFGSLTRSC